MSMHAPESQRFLRRASLLIRRFVALSIATGARMFKDSSPENLRLGDVQVSLVCWSEVPSTSFRETLRPLILSRMALQEPLYEQEFEGKFVRIKPHGVGFRFFVEAWERDAKFRSVMETKRFLEDLEALAVRCVQNFFGQAVPGPLWIYFYPMWFIGRVVPDFKRISELESPLMISADQLLYMDPERIREIYPLEVVTPEIATEELPSRIVVFDRSLRKEAIIVVARGIAVILRASTEFRDWLRQVIATRVEPRPYVSFKDLVPRRAEAVQRFPVIQRVQLVSGKGWIDNMVVIEEALNQYSLASKFVETEESVVESFVLSLSIAMLTLSLGLLAVTFRPILVALSFAWALDAAMFVGARVIASRIPRLARRITTVAIFLFYSFMLASIVGLGFIATGSLLSSS